MDLDQRLQAMSIEELINFIRMRRIRINYLEREIRYCVDRHPDAGMVADPVVTPDEDLRTQLLVSEAELALAEQVKRERNAVGMAPRSDGIRSDPHRQ